MFISGNDFLTVSSVLLTRDVKSKMLVGVSKETTKESLKSLNIVARILAKQSNAI